MNHVNMLLMAAKHSPYADTDTVFDVIADSEHLTHGMFVTGTTTIDWGDGATDSTSSAASATLDSATIQTHTYAEAGTYTVKVSGTGYRICHSNGSSSYWPSGASRLLTRIRHIGSNLYSANSMFANCKISKVDNGCKFKVVTSHEMVSCFQATAGGGGYSLPDDFALPDGVTNLLYAFYQGGNTNFPAQIPSTTTSMQSCFGFNGSMTSLRADFRIPAGCTNLNGTFNFCARLRHDISNLFPEEWATGTRNINVNNLFNRTDAKITGTAPANLLWNSSNNFTNTSGTFSGCTGLSNYNEIPASWGGGGA